MPESICSSVPAARSIVLLPLCPLYRLPFPVVPVFIFAPDVTSSISPLPNPLCMTPPLYTSMSASESVRVILPAAFVGPLFFPRTRNPASRLTVPWRSR